jgi:hypothetical protein
MLESLIGKIPNESGFIKKHRFHQGWWRTFVLGQEQGKYWNKTAKKWDVVCNRINNGDIDPHKKNFLSKEITEEVHEALDLQSKFESGIIEKDRLYNNLLSSQPLAFNFFGFFKANPAIALAFLKSIHSDIISIAEIVFEFAPDSTSDHSAFDFGFKVKTDSSSGFIGFECKYTDTFSYKNPKTNIFYGDELDKKNFKHYHQIYLNNRKRFPDDYFSYIRNANYNQLFRNELLAMQLNTEYEFIITGLFCHNDDKKTTEAGNKFQKKIGNGISDFIVLTYKDYFERMQKLNLTWQQRELVMMLWARYCGLNLSESISRL